MYRSVYQHWRLYNYQIFYIHIKHNFFWRLYNYLPNKHFMRFYSDFLNIHLLHKINLQKSHIHFSQINNICSGGVFLFNFVEVNVCINIMDDSKHKLSNFLYNETNLIYQGEQGNMVKFCKGNREKSKNFTRNTGTHQLTL